MSRHRNVRSMRYSDEYDGYDDVYGHSVEEDYSISPSDAAFMYDRSNQQRQISSLLSTEENIVEEDEVLCEGPEISNLNDVDKAKLMSCLDEIRNVLGDSLPETIILETIVASNYNISVALDQLLNKSVGTEKKDTESPKPQRTIPLRRYDRGEGYPNKQACLDGKEDVIETDKRDKMIFNVEEFLTSSNNKDLKLDLSKALFKRDLEIETESSPKLKTEKFKLFPNSMETEDISVLKSKREPGYVFLKMSIDELIKVRPSKLGFFVCKCLTEFNASYSFTPKKIEVCNTNIVPFKFDCLSPDEEVYRNRKW